MKAITLWQPWATLVARKVKVIETRSWSTNYRGPLAIHASKRCIAGPIGEFDVKDYTPRGGAKQYLMRGESLSWPYRLPLGAIVATCTLLDVVPMEAEDVVDTADPVLVIEQDEGLSLSWGPDYYGEANEEDVSREFPYGDYQPGRFAWVLGGINPVEPIPWKGAQGLWEWRS